MRWEVGGVVVRGSITYRHTKPGRSLRLRLRSLLVNQFGHLGLMDGQFRCYCIIMQEAKGYLAVISPFRTVNIWDLRKMKAKTPLPLWTGKHAKSVESAYFSPVTGHQLLTTSMDDTFGLFSTDEILAGQGCVQKHFIRSVYNVSIINRAGKHAKTSHHVRYLHSVIGYFDLSQTLFNIPSVAWGKQVIPVLVYLELSHLFAQK